MDTIFTFARHVADTTFDTVPQGAIQIAKMSFLDTIGNLIAGATARACPEVADLVLEWGGKPESTVLMRGGKVPAHNAALINGLMARAIDFDDAMHKGMHLNASFVPVALAIAEKRGGASGRGGSSGKDVLAALALGADIAGRIDSAVAGYNGFDPTICCGIFGATTVAAKLLDLDEGQIANAYGIALNQASGSFQGNVDSALSVRLNQGIAAGAGITSVLFASCGITGVKNVLEGQWGYFHLFSRGQYDPEHLTTGLGTEFYSKFTVFRRWPGCGGSQSAADGILQLVEENDLRPEQIEKVLVRCGRFFYNLIGQPFKIGENPVVSAQFNIRYIVSNIILRRRPLLDHFTELYIRDPKIMDFTQRVEIIPDDTPLYTQPPYHNGAEVTVILKDGRTLTRYIKSWHGHFTDPLAMDDIVEKFYRNLDYASAWFDRSVGPRIVDFVAGLEGLGDVTTLVDLLRFREQVE